MLGYDALSDAQFRRMWYAGRSAATVLGGAVEAGLQGGPAEPRDDDHRSTVRGGGGGDEPATQGEQQEEVHERGHELGGRNCAECFLFVSFSIVLAFVLTTSPTVRLASSTFSSRPHGASRSRNRGKAREPVARGCACDGLERGAALERSKTTRRQQQEEAARLAEKVQADHEKQRMALQREQEKERNETLRREAAELEEAAMANNDQGSGSRRFSWQYK